MNRIEAMEYAEKVYRLNWIWSQIVVLAEMIDSLLVDAKAINDIVIANAFRDDKMRLKTICNTIINARHIIQKVQAKQSYEPERADAIDEVADVLYNLCIVINAKADIGEDNVNEVIASYRELIDCLRERKAQHDVRIKELTEQIQAETK